MIDTTGKNSLKAAKSRKAIGACARDAFYLLREVVIA